MLCTDFMMSSLKTSSDRKDIVLSSLQPTKKKNIYVNILYFTRAFSPSRDCLIGVKHFNIHDPCQMGANTGPAYLKSAHVSRSENIFVASFFQLTFS